MRAESLVSYRRPIDFVLIARSLKVANPRRKGFRIPLLTWGAVYFLFWAYRSIFSVIGEVFIMRLTPISDTRTYQASDLVASLIEFQGGAFNTLLGAGGLGFQAIATILTQIIGGAFGALFFHNAIMSNIGFQTIGFVGLLVFLRALAPRERAYLLPLLMLPSVTVWTSIASKEALLTFLLGIICAHVVNIYKNNDEIRWYHWLCLFLLYVFKPHFFISIMFVLLVTYAAKFCRQKATVAILAMIFSFGLLFVYRENFSELANWTNVALTSMGGDSARPVLLVEKYDVFYKAPYGMFLSFFGPTIYEVNKFLQLLTFLESLIIITVLTVLLIRGFVILPIYSLILGAGAIFWVIFLSYPLGATNAGTAIRYRSGYVLIVFLAFIIMSSPSFYVEWSRGLRSRLRPVRNRMIRRGLIKKRPSETS